MLNNYKKELAAIAVAFGLISYAVYVCAATPAPVAPAAKAALDKKAAPAKKAEPAKKEAAKPAAKKEAAKPAEPKKEHKKKPTLKAKYADKK